MKKIIIVNNNMKVGGVQKSLYNLLWAIYEKYDITLVLFKATGEYINKLPESIKIIECNSLFQLLGISQSECETKLISLLRGFFAGLCKVFGRQFIIKLFYLSQKKIPGNYDVAISFLQNGNPHHFYGGVNEFVLRKITSIKKVAFLHCDYYNCGANDSINNKLYYKFDKIAACSEGCRNSFLNAIPDLKEKCFTVHNFHRFELIKTLAEKDLVRYNSITINIIMVGRLAHEKGVDRAIKAVAYVKKHNVPILLHIIGDGNKREELEEIARKLKIQDDIIFYGEQSNPYKYMKNADLLLMTSYHEAAPMVIDEARVLGLPVLTTKTTSSEEMILPYQGGWICDNTQEAINNSLLEITSDRDALTKAKELLKNEVYDNFSAKKEFCSVLGE